MKTLSQLVWPLLYLVHNIVNPELGNFVISFCLSCLRTVAWRRWHMYYLTLVSRLALTSGSPGSGTLLDVARQRGSGLSPHSGVGLPERRKRTKDCNWEVRWLCSKQCIYWMHELSWSNMKRFIYVYVVVMCIKWKGHAPFFMPDFFVLKFYEFHWPYLSVLFC